MSLVGTNIFGISITNVIIIFLILLLGWKNGMLLGGISGISVGLAVGMIGGITPIQMATFAVSGILAGFLNRFGKLGVIIGFVLGNCILTFLYSGNIETIIYFREIFIASVGLLFVPSNIKLDLEDIIGRNKMITSEGEYRLEGDNTVSQKLNVVKEAITEITKKYTQLEDEVFAESEKDNFISILESNLQDKKDNIFYEELYENLDGIDDDIFYVLQQKEKIIDKDLIEIFSIHNNYVCNQIDSVKKDLDEVVSIINKTYKMNDIETAKKEEQQIQTSKIVNELENVKEMITDVVKESEKTDELENKKIEKEIGILLTKKNFKIHGVRYRKINNGKIIVDLKFDYSEELKTREKIVIIENTISKILEVKLAFQKDKKNSKNDYYFQTYSTEDKFSIQTGISKIMKDESKFSGDSNLELKLDDGKYLLAISDGMGSGSEARETSSTVLKLIKSFIGAGFERERTIDLINSSLNLNLNEEMYASLDLAVFDLHDGNLVSIKNGSSNSYIKNKKNVKVLKSEQLPLGIVDKITTKEEVIKLVDGDIIVLISDGVLESKDITNSDWLCEFLKNANTNNVQKLADLILAEALENSYGTAGDDMTVMVAKITKRK